MGLADRYNQLNKLVNKASYVYKEEGLQSLLKKCSLFMIRPVPFLYKVYFELVSKYKRNNVNHDVDDYTAPLNPYKIISVDPENITEYTRRPRIHTLGMVKDEDWDIQNNISYRRDFPKKRKELFNKLRPSIYIEESLKYKAMKNHFQNNIPWTETKYIQFAFDYVEDGNSIWNCTTKREITERCENMDELYNNMEKNGYISQLKRKKLKPFYDFLDGEIRVDIGRDGQFLFASGGRHRLYISKILGLEEVLVVVFCRHNQWMEHRDRVYRGDAENDHPDLLDL